jgi:hypothetical protein
MESGPWRQDFRPAPPDGDGPRHGFVQANQVGAVPLRPGRARCVVLIASLFRGRSGVNDRGIGKGLLQPLEVFAEQRADVLDGGERTASPADLAAGQVAVPLDPEPLAAASSTPIT